MALFKFIGDIETVFGGLRGPDGATVVAQPGAEVEVADVVHPNAAAHPDLEPVDDAAKKMVDAANEAIRIDASRVMVDPAPVADTEAAPVDPPAGSPGDSSASAPTKTPTPPATEEVPEPAAVPEATEVEETPEAPPA